MLMTLPSISQDTSPNGNYVTRHDILKNLEPFILVTFKYVREKLTFFSASKTLLFQLSTTLHMSDNYSVEALIQLCSSP